MVQEAIHYEARILRLLPVLQVSQVLEECWVLKVAVLRKPWKSRAPSANLSYLWYHQLGRTLYSKQRPGEQFR